PENRGLAGALNIGLSYWLANPSIQAISYFQDDVEVDPLCIAACNEAIQQMGPADFERGMVVTGHDAKEHRERWQLERYFGSSFSGIDMFKRGSCRATHMHAHIDAWKKVLPIPSRGLGLPGTRIMDG